MANIIFKYGFDAEGLKIDLITNGDDLWHVEQDGNIVTDNTTDFDSAQTKFFELAANE